ncbi:uncharacterized protein BDR25DRAFT_361368, partial [Lindgomyces ingoldianus]
LTTLRPVRACHLPATGGYIGRQIHFITVPSLISILTQLDAFHIGSDSVSTMKAKSKPYQTRLYPSMPVKASPSIMPWMYESPMKVYPSSSSDSPATPVAR